MTSDLQMGAPTVTVFGTRDAVDAALSDELERRGRSTHAVTTPVGWLRSATHAVVRLDSAAGERALRDLAALDDVTATQVVAVCETPLDAATSARLDQLCRECGLRHEISLIWHPPFEARLVDTLDDLPVRAVLAPAELATTIADAVGAQEGHPSTPAFASQLFDPHGAGRTPGHA